MKIAVNDFFNCKITRERKKYSHRDNSFDGDDNVTTCTLYSGSNYRYFNFFPLDGGAASNQCHDIIVVIIIYFCSHLFFLPFNQDIMRAVGQNHF